MAIKEFPSAHCLNSDKYLDAFVRQHCQEKKMEGSARKHYVVKSNPLRL